MKTFVFYLNNMFKIYFDNFFEVTHDIDKSMSCLFELFVVSFMQEDVYTGHTALALTLALQVFS